MIRFVFGMFVVFCIVSVGIPVMRADGTVNLAGCVPGEEPWMRC